MAISYWLGPTNQERRDIHVNIADSFMRKRCKYGPLRNIPSQVFETCMAISYWSGPTNQERRDIHVSTADCRRGLSFSTVIQSTQCF